MKCWTQEWSGYDSCIPLWPSETTGSTPCMYDSRILNWESSPHLNPCQIHLSWRKNLLSVGSKFKFYICCFQYSISWIASVPLSRSDLSYSSKESCILASSSPTVFRNHSMSFFFPSLLYWRKWLIISLIIFNWFCVFSHLLNLNYAGYFQFYSRSVTRPYLFVTYL